MKKTITLVITTMLILVILSGVLLSVGCSNSADKLKVSIDGVEQNACLEQKQDSEWFIDVDLKANSTVTVRDENGGKHTIDVKDGGKYTILLTKDGKNYNVEARKEKRAIIWVTALLSGGLYDAENNTPAWDPIPFDDITLIDFLDETKMVDTALDLVMRMTSLDSPLRLKDLVNPIKNNEKSERNLFWNIGFNNDGKPNNPNIQPANGFDGKIQYGVLGAYKTHFEDMNERYNPKDCEFRVFNYDWRFDCALGATALEEYIEENKFTDVILFSHSMGGNVVANYLARSSYNRARIARYISMGGAFLGSFDALYTMENIQDYFGSVLDNMGMAGLLDGLSSLPINIDIDINVIFEQLQTFIINMDTFVQLLPSYELIASKQYGEDGDGDAITIDGKAIQSADELYAFYESRPWAWKKDADDNYILDGDKHVVRDIVKNLRDFHESMYVTMPDGSKLFSTALVDTYYITGKNIVSFAGADYTSDGNVTFRTTTNGDLQVLFYSVIANLDEELLRKENRIVEFDGFNHLQVGCVWDLVKELSFEKIDEIFG